jgi:hypothetical protein
MAAGARGGRNSSCASGANGKLSLQQVRGYFAFISPLTLIPFVLATYPDHPVKSVPDLIKKLKSSSKPMFYGTSGVGTTQHLSGALFTAMAKVSLQHVASKGGTAVPTMLLGKHIDFVFETPTLTLELVKSGKLRALGTTGKTRFLALPDVPTIGETIPGYETTSWLGLGAPAAAGGYRQAPQCRDDGDTGGARDRREVPGARQRALPGDAGSLQGARGRRYRQVDQGRGRCRNPAYRCLRRGVWRSFTPALRRPARWLRRPT